MDTKFILVVEDDPILKNLLGHTFAGKYQTLYASNGNEALALFEQYKPGLVLLDLMLPDVDGFTVLQTIRARTDALNSTPVIIISNLGQDSDKDKAKALGANDYLVKAEVEVDEIVGHIEKVLGVQQIAAGEAAGFAAVSAAATAASIQAPQVTPPSMVMPAATAVAPAAPAFEVPVMEQPSVVYDAPAQPAADPASAPQTPEAPLA